MRGAGFSAALTISVALLVGACSQGAGTVGLGGGPAVRNDTLVYGGVSRSFRVYAPPTVDPHTARPLVVVLHGGASGIEDTVTTTMFDQTAATGNFIVAYPLGTREEWNAGFCCGSAPRRMVDDVGFLNALLDRLEATYAVDPHRVYFTGVSNGAMMAYAYACAHAERVTAVGSVAGAMDLNACHPSGPVSVLELHGTEDGEVPYQGGRDLVDAGATFDYPSSEAVVSRWAVVDGCEAQPHTSTAGTVITQVWSNCQNGTAASLVSVQGGGHVWFASGLGPTDGVLDATSTIWSFFQGMRSP